MRLVVRPNSIEGLKCVKQPGTGLFHTFQLSSVGPLVRLLIALSFALMRFVAAAEAPEAAPPGDDSGLKLILTIEPSKNDGADVQEFRLELKNTGERSVRLLHRWEAETESSAFEDELKFCTLTAVPDVSTGGGFQTTWTPKKFGHKSIELAPGTSRVTNFKVKPVAGVFVGGLLFYEPGKYEVKATCCLSVMDSAAGWSPSIFSDLRWITSDPQPFIVGGSTAEPRRTVAHIVSIDRDSNTAKINLGSDDNIAAEDLFEPDQRQGGRLRVDRVEAKESAVTLVSGRGRPAPIARTGDYNTHIENCIAVKARIVQLRPETNPNWELSQAIQFSNIQQVNEILDENPKAIDAASSLYGQWPLNSAIHQMKEGKTEIVELLLKRGAAVNGRGYFGETPLHCAAGRGDARLIALLLERGAEVNATATSERRGSGAGETPLHRAASYGNVEAVRMLLEHHADPNAKTAEGATPLYFAAWRGHLDAMKLLLAQPGADVHARLNDGKTLLHAAANSGKREAAELLIERGADPKAVDAEGRSALYFAADYAHRYGDLEQRLASLSLKEAEPSTQCSPAPAVSVTSVARKAESLPDYLSSQGAPDDIWSLMLREKTSDAAKFLAAHPEVANQPGPDERSPLLWAIKEKHAELFNVLLAANPDVELRDRFGRTALHWAARLGDLAAATALLKKGAEVKVRDDVDSSSPLHLAAKAGRAALVKLLAAHGAEIDARTAYGQTPLMECLNALCHERFFEETADIEPSHSFNFNPYQSTEKFITRDEAPEVVKALLEHGAAVNVRDGADVTPLHFAVLGKHAAVVELLAANGADVNAADNAGRTPLHRPAEFSPFSMHFDGPDPEAAEITRILLEHKAAADLKDKEGYTPLLRESEHGCADAVQALLAAKASAAATTTHGETALHLAVRSGNMDTVVVLADAKLDANASNKDGQTPLHWAARAPCGGEGGAAKYRDIARVLLSCGADPKAKDKEGKTPHDFIQTRIREFNGPEKSRELELLQEIKFILEEPSAKKKAFIDWNPKTATIGARGIGPRADEMSVELATFVFVYPKDQDAYIARHFKNYGEILQQTGRTLPARLAPLNFLDVDIESVISYFSMTARLNLISDPRAENIRAKKRVTIRNADGTAADALFFVCVLGDLEAEFQKPEGRIPGQLNLRAAEITPVGSDEKKER